MYTNEQLEELARRYPVEGDDEELLPTEDERVQWVEQVSAEEIFELLGPPSGVGLPRGLIGGQELALAEEELRRGDFAQVNQVTRRGLRVLQVLRLGSAPDGAYYELKAQMQGGVEVEQWPWADEERKMFLLHMVWQRRSPAANLDGV